MSAPSDVAKVIRLIQDGKTVTEIVAETRLPREFVEKIFAKTQPPTE
jgi:hypothetical protein